MSEIEMLDNELKRIEVFKGECVSGGVIIPAQKYRYQELMRLENSLILTKEWIKSRGNNEKKNEYGN